METGLFVVGVFLGWDGREKGENCCSFYIQRAGPGNSLHDTIFRGSGLRNVGKHRNFGTVPLAIRTIFPQSVRTRNRLAVSAAHD